MTVKRRASTELTPLRATLGASQDARPASQHAQKHPNTLARPCHPALVLGCARTSCWLIPPISGLECRLPPALVRLFRE